LKCIMTRNNNNFDAKGKANLNCSCTHKLKLFVCRVNAIYFFIAQNKSQ
jgi:hypothetical protein